MPVSVLVEVVGCLSVVGADVGGVAEEPLEEAELLGEIAGVEWLA